jgi:hypothetical protein
LFLEPRRLRETLIVKREPAGKRSDFFRQNLMALDARLRPLALLAAKRDHAGAAMTHEPHRIAFYLFDLQVNFVHFGRFATFMP